MAFQSAQAVRIDQKVVDESHFAYFTDTGLTQYFQKSGFHSVGENEN